MRHKKEHEHRHHLGFMGLEHKVALEYERKGVKKSKAERWAAGTAANVYREQKHKCGGMHCTHHSHIGEHILR